MGMMGTGKSTVARSLADVMGRYIFLDTDSIIEELLGASVGEVFATDGEEAFRSVESQVLDQVGLYVLRRSWGRGMGAGGWRGGEGRGGGGEGGSMVVVGTRYIVHNGDVGETMMSA